MSVRPFIKHTEYYKQIASYTFMSFTPVTMVTFAATAAFYALKQLAMKGGALIGVKALQGRAFAPLSEITNEKTHKLFIVAFALSVLVARILLENPRAFYEKLVPTALENQQPVEKVLEAHTISQNNGAPLKASVDNLLLMLDFHGFRELEALPSPVPLEEVVARTGTLEENQKKLQDEARIQLIKQLIPDDLQLKQVASKTLNFILDAEGDEALLLQEHIPTLIKLLGPALDDNKKITILFALLNKWALNLNQTPYCDNTLTQAKIRTFIKATHMDLNALQKNGLTPLTFIGNRLLLEQKNNNLTPEKQESAKKLVHTFIANRARLSEKNAMGWHLLDAAMDLAEKGNSFLLEELLAHKDTSFNLTSGASPLTYIINVAPQLHPILEKALEKKTFQSSLNFEEALGQTPLIAAIKYGLRTQDYRLMKLLLEKGALPNKQNRNGHAALHLVLSQESIDTYPLGLLLNYGADMKVTDQTGMSAQNLLESFDDFGLANFVQREMSNRKFFLGSGKELGTGSNDNSRETEKPAPLSEEAIRTLRAKHFKFKVQTARNEAANAIE